VWADANTLIFASAGAPDMLAFNNTAAPHQHCRFGADHLGPRLGMLGWGWGLTALAFVGVFLVAFDSDL